MPIGRGVADWTKNELSFAVWALHPASYSKKYIGLRFVRRKPSFLAICKSRERRFIFMQRKTKQNTKKLVFSALMTAMCIIIGWVCKSYLTFGAIRVTFENIPVLLAGILLGPAAGGAVGAAADIISALLSGFSINPVVTLGAASVGIVAGLISRYVVRSRGFLPVLASVMPAHIVGSMVIKSFGLWYFYGYALPLIFARIPLYLAIGLAETYIIYIICKNSRLATAFVSKGEKK